MRAFLFILLLSTGQFVFSQTLDSLKSVYNEDIIPLNSDRPGATYNPSTVGKGALMTQVGMEIGGHRLYKWDIESASVKGAVDVRYGIGDKWEVGSFISGYSNNIQGPRIEDQTRNTSSYSLNLRYNILEKDFGSIGMLGDVAYGKDREEDYMTYMLKLMYSVSLNNVIGVSSNLGYNYSEGSSWANYTLNLGFGLYDDFGFYLETYGNLSNTTNEVWVDAGCWYLVDPNIQLDILIAKGFNNNVQDYFGSVGVSWRILEPK